MNNPSTLDDGAVNHFPVRPWTEFVILALGLPAAIWVASKLIKLSIPAATHGSPGERFLLWIAGPAIAEWLFVLGVVFVLRHRQLSLKDIDSVRGAMVLSIISKKVLSILLLICSALLCLGSQSAWGNQQGVAPRNGD
jgi:hypothetical protein